MANVAILGYGIVGSGVSEVIRTNAKSIEKRAGQSVTVKKILDIRDFTEGPDLNLLTKNADEVFENTDIDIVVETIGGARIAYDFTVRALKAKKHVVTSNKELVATYGPELMKLAKENGVSYLFEASVGGGIPIIRPLNRCLAANSIYGIQGILNGTTNYILTKMQNEGMSFETALREAQEKGYAEADPTADIEGHDTCRKLAILSSIAFNCFVDYKDIYTTGISQITYEDMQYAKEASCVIKLVAQSCFEDNNIYSTVSPCFVPIENTLSFVNDVYNAITVKGNAVGDTMFYGRGAGKLPTASAVVADIIDIVKNEENCQLLPWKKCDQINIVDIKYSKTKMFIRLETEDREKAFEVAKEYFGNIELISPEKVEKTKEIAFITYTEELGTLQEKLRKYRDTGVTTSLVNCIKVLE